MKRIMLRFVVLSAVVIAGGLAILQAQRSLSRLAEASESSPAGVASKAADDAPQRLPPPATANPLRPNSSPVGGVVQAAGTESLSEPTLPLALARTKTATDAGDVASPIASGKSAFDAAAPDAKTANPLFQRATTVVRTSAEPAESAERLGGAVANAAPSSEVLGGEGPRLTRVAGPSDPPRSAAKTERASEKATAPTAAAAPNASVAAAPASPDVGNAGSGGLSSPRGVGVRMADASSASKRFAEPGRLPGGSSGGSSGGSLGRLSAAEGSARDASVADAGSSDPARLGDGTGKPGVAQLEGPQTPQLVIQKSAPLEVQVGRPAVFQIRVKNIGATIARHVEVRDEIPKGTRLIDSTPRASRGVSGELVWTIGTMKPGEETNVQVQLMPVEEGEIGSVATVAFHADASAKAVATKPQLVIKASVASKVLIGETAKLTITLSNPGTGIARKVFLDAHIPQGLRHPGGTELAYEVGDLKPGESRQIELQLTAAGPGAAANVLTARAEGGLRIEDRQNIDVLAPQIDIAMEGPKRRYLEREATYVFSISNPGTAAARQVELVAQLPTGLKFVSANNAGRYEEASRTVRWLLEELPIKESGTVELVTVPTEAGRQVLRLRGRSERSSPVEKEHPVQIEGIAALLFEVVDTNDPIEVGGETTYEIRVVNQGSKAATNVELVGLLPADMKAVAAEGPTRQSIDGNRVVFEPLGTLAAKASTTYRVRAQGLKAGDQRFRVQLLTDEIRTPITKEESTRVYADE